MSENKFFICKKCGNLVGMIVNSGVPMMCCGEKMQQIIPNTVEASVEKHLPVVSISGDSVRVSVGTVAHPMLDEHYIEWIYIQTANGGQRKSLKPGDAPEVVFSLGSEKAIAVFCYCNLHGLWKTEL